MGAPSLFYLSRERGTTYLPPTYIDRDSVYLPEEEEVIGCCSSSSLYNYRVGCYWRKIKQFVSNKYLEEDSHDVVFASDTDTL